MEGQAHDLNLLQGQCESSISPSLKALTLPTPCKVCSEPMPTVAAYNAHVKSAHPAEDLVRPFCCDLCGRGFHFEQVNTRHKDTACMVGKLVSPS